MNKITIPAKSTTNNGDQGKLETRFGLPAEIQFCNSCVISNQRPNSAIEYSHTKKSKKKTINIAQDGVCDACKIAKHKDIHIDWDEREKQLIELCNKYRRNDGRYDCIVPGSGGKDSFYAAHILKYQYNMHPLTVTWAPHLYTHWGWENFQLWIHAGFDNILETPNGLVHRLLTRLAVDTIFHPFQPFIIGQKALTPKLSIKYDIPLVFYGENEAEYGNPSQDMDSALRSWEYFTMSDESKIFLSGVSLQELKECYGLNSNDLYPYLPANPDQIAQVGVQVHYLGYYLQWHPQGAYYYSVEHGGFKPSPERTPGTYSKYNSIDDKMDDFNFYSLFIKYGIGRASYDASQEIRNDEITRDEGIALVKRYDGEFPERFAEEIFNYLSIPKSQYPKASKQLNDPIMTKESFMSLADSFRSSHLWKKEGSTWSLRKTVFSNN